MAQKAIRRFVGCAASEAKKPSKDGFFVSLTDIRNQASLSRLQIIIFGKVDGEVPCHRLGISQLGVDHHTFHTVDDGGHAPLYKTWSDFHASGKPALQ